MFNTITHGVLEQAGNEVIISLVDASGGTITYDGDFRIHTFDVSGNFIVYQGGDVSILIVAGGGAGGK